MSKSIALSNASSPEEFQALVDMKRRKRMARIDALPAATRNLVNEYGFAVVDCLMALGVTKPNQIKHVVETILDEFSPTRGSSSHQGVTVMSGGFRRPLREQP